MGLHPRVLRVDGLQIYLWICWFLAEKICERGVTNLILCEKIDLVCRPPLVDLVPARYIFFANVPVKMREHSNIW